MNVDLYRICEGVKQILLLRGNKKIFFIPAGVNMFFTPSQNGFWAIFGGLPSAKTFKKCGFLVKKCHL